MSEYSRGVAILNDSKYGYSALNNVLRLSLKVVVDMLEYSRGVAILNDSKYGYSTLNNVLSRSL